MAEKSVQLTIRVPPRVAHTYKILARSSGHSINAITSDVLVTALRLYGLEPPPNAPMGMNGAPSMPRA